ncbi:MAG TPA: glycosyltransferase family 9 protein [Chitinophagaceae bacterium]|jgi:ADP-heptose:LPS heptosyltransferase|nr:glycosyltransferase family 9 protein [Chitinophagaceae bacterium]
MNLLVIRMSAMGDVALTVPAIRSVLDTYPEMHLTLVTKKQFLPFFENIDRLDLIAAEVKGKHRGIPGLRRLFKEIRGSGRIDAVIDLHDVLRSRILSFFFKNAGLPVFRIDKGRKEKKQLTARKEKRRVPLPHTVTRYLNVFGKAGFPAILSVRTNWFNHITFPESFLQKAHLLPKTVSWIGIAPFAKHREKSWPLDKVARLIAAFDPSDTLVFLFGGGEKEVARLNRLKEKYTHVIVVAGALTLTEELGLISKLDVMISMDSANMHLAALCGTPVVSIWGATHPFAGFGPLGGNEKFMVQISAEKLPCRPCSVFGNKPCYRGDHACMEWITPEQVLETVEKAVKETR